MTPKEVLALCREKDVKAVDLRFTDMLGTWHHFTIPVGRLSEDTFEDGLGFDGASIRGWQAINESDMLVTPQPATAFLDPFTDIPTLIMIGNVQDPVTGEDYRRDPRHIARRAENYLKSTGVADTAYFGPEVEFFVFDNVRFDQKGHEAYYFLDSEEGQWNRGHAGSDSTLWGTNLGYTVRHQEGYSPVPPHDHLMNLRNVMMQRMHDCGLQVDAHHHEAASGGQTEIDLRFQPLVRMSDWMMIYKYVVKNVARDHGKTATFMPKPIFGDKGSGLHTHVSLWKDNEPLFAGSGYAGLSDMALHAIGGLLRHAGSLMAFANPTTNSYKRLVAGQEAPVNLGFSQRNRSSACRVPMYSNSPKTKRIEFRCPDPSCNPYLAFAAMLMAIVDGVQNKISPGEPLDRELYDPAVNPRLVPKTPSSLAEALAALEQDYEFLLRGDVFAEDFLQTWISYKRQAEVDAVHIRPHPYEFCLYYDV